jgi:hypothetical protein
MAASLLAQDDFWKAITEEMCKSLEESTSEFNNAGWVSRAFGEDHRKGDPMLAQPSAGQAAEDTRYAKQLQFSMETASRMLVVQTSQAQTVGSREDLIGEHTGASPLPHITPVTDQVMTNPASSATAGPTSNIDNAEMLISLNAVSPTSAAKLVPVGGEEVASQPSQNSDVERKVNRKLSFGLSDFGERLMPPPNVRRTSAGSEDDLFAHFIHTDTRAPAGSEVSFPDLPTSPSQGQPTSPSENVQLDQQPPKTPVLADFGSSSSTAIQGNTNDSYPTCIDGMGLKIPPHHLEYLRSVVDPTFQNDEWGDGIYFLDEPVYSSYSNSSELYGFRRKDWSIIFHALDNGSDRQFPLPDTKTQPLFTDEQAHRIAYGPTHADQRKAMVRAAFERIHTHKQKNEAGLMWTQIIGNYHSEPPEFAIASTEKMCASPQFKTFCKFASFFEGRHLEKPDLDDARAVLRYAQFPKLLLNSPRINVVGQQVQHASQHLMPANAALLPDTVNPPDLQFQSSPPSAPSSTPLQEQYQQPPQQSPQRPVPQQPEQMIQTMRPNPALMNNAYNNFNVFRALPFPLLSRFHTQYIRARALHYGRLGQLIPNAAPTYRNMWQAFRRDVEVSRAAAQTRQTRTLVPGVPPPEIQAAREAAIRQAQARMAQNLVGAGAGTSASSRPVQLQSHMPTTPPETEENQQANGSGRMMASATELGSPFMTPRPRRRDD